jgi:hypothetical protein
LAVTAIRSRTTSIGIAFACLLLAACDDFAWYHVRTKASIDEKCAVAAASADGFEMLYRDSNPQYNEWRVDFKSQDDRGGPSMEQDTKGHFVVIWFGAPGGRPPIWRPEMVAKRLNSLMRDVYRTCASPPLPSTLPITCDMRRDFEYVPCPGFWQSHGSCDERIRHEKKDCPGQLLLADPAPSASPSTGRP